MRKFPGLIQTVSAAIAGAGTPYYSGAIPVGDNGNYWIGVKFTGSNVVGTLSLEESLDGLSTSDWYPVSNSSQAVSASADHAWNAPTTAANYVRVKWVYTSGTGNISAEASVSDKIFQQG